MKSISQKKPKTYPVYSLSFFRAYGIHMRPYLLFVSGVAGCAGLAVSSSLLSVQNYSLVFIAVFLGYGFGQALTDCFQIDTDSISSPYRPLVRGVISKRDVLVVSIIGLAFIGIVFVCLNFLNLVLILLSGFGLLTYTYFKKNHWYLGPFWNSWIVMLLVISGFLATNSAFSFTDVLNNSNLLILCLLTFASYANFVVIGYLKDITADKETGYKTFPVLFGWNKTIWIGNLNVLVSIVCCYLLTISSNYYALAIYVLASAVAIAGQVYGLVTKEKNELNSALTVLATVRSFILWHLAVIIAFKPAALILILSAAFYIAFEVVIYNRPQKEQV